MGFMEPEITFGEWYMVETTHGTDIVPADVAGDIGLAMGQTADDDTEGWDGMVAALRDYLSGGDVQEIGMIQGFGARLSAPGYMDCTEWSVFASEKEARDYLAETYPDDDEAPEGWDSVD